jgi:RNA polymerase sigma-70 factor, ECF subfamily
MEQDLIRRANQGEETALNELYETHRSFVFNLAHRYLENHADSFDVVQEVFAVLFKKFPGFVLTCELRTYLFPITRNNCMSRLRKKRPFCDPQILESEEDHTLRNELNERQRVLDMVANLPEQHRQVLILRFVDQLSLDEIAQHLAIPVGTVKSRLFNGLKKLREHGDFLWILSLLKLGDF